MMEKSQASARTHIIEERSKIMTKDETIQALKERATEMRRVGLLTRHVTAHEDAQLLEHAAMLLEKTP